MKKTRFGSRPSRSRWVVKVGSNLICSGGPLLLRAWMQQVAKLSLEGFEIIWVTSGAIASAVERTQRGASERSLVEKQALSAIGQPLLMDLYNLSLQAVGLIGAQILLTYEDMGDATRRGNLEITLNKLLEWKVVPILNENDAVATEEIKFGDNDSLSAKVACMMKADRLVILTDVEGLYDTNPSKNPRAKLVAHLPFIDESWLKKIGKQAGSSRGTGGMYSKLLAAREANQQGIETWLLKGDAPNALLRIASGERMGSRLGGKS